MVALYQSMWPRSLPNTAQKMLTTVQVKQLLDAANQIGRNDGCIQHC
jgi:hypothetical protein